MRAERAHLIHYDNTQQIREDIARTVPLYDGIQYLRQKGDQFQWGGPLLCAGYRFNTPDGKAHFEVAQIPEREIPEGKFLVGTRRGQQHGLG